MAIELEKIKPWDGQSGTGADNRGVIDRNFEKVETELENVDLRFEDVEDEIFQLAGEEFYFSQNGYITTGGAIHGKESNVHINTGFVRYFRGDIKVSGYASSSTRIVFFYDKYLKGISGYDAGTGVKNNIVISESEIPSGTYFIIAQARSGDGNAELVTKRIATDFFDNIENYKSEILLLDELDSTISTPTFDANDLPVNVVHKDARGRTVRTDAFVFSETEIVETRTFGDATKTFTTELSTLKTTIL